LKPVRGATVEVGAGILKVVEKEKTVSRHGEKNYEEKDVKRDQAFLYTS